LANDFLDAFDAEHLSPGIENFGNPICIENDAVVRLEVHFLVGGGIHGVR
jgi:hypothetical protein